MANLEIDGFAIYWDEDGKPTMVEAEEVPPSGRKITPDPRVIREARERMRERKENPPNPKAA
jgi:hypothetical protein